MAAPKPRFNVEVKSLNQKRIEHCFDVSNRTLGIGPMSEERIGSIMRSQVLRDVPDDLKKEKACEIAVTDFFEGEMAMTTEESHTVGINKMFFPKKTGKNGKKMIYIEFSDLKQKAKISGRAHLLKVHENPNKQPFICKYHTPEIYPRYSDIETYAWKLRVAAKDKGQPISTNIRFGVADYDMRIRPHKDSPLSPTYPEPWDMIEPITLPKDLAPVQFGRPPKPSVRQPTGRAPTPTEDTPPPS